MQARTTNVIVVVTVITVVVAVAFASFTSRSEIVNSSTSIGQATAFHSTVSSPSNGLELRVDLNTTRIASGRSIAALISLFNPLGKNLSLVPRYSANSTLSEWKDYDFLCGGTDVSGYDISSMVGFALFSGHYSADNISHAPTPPLQLAPSVGMPCVTWPAPVRVVFLPNSDNGVLYVGDFQTGSLAQIMLNAATQSCSGSSTGGYCGGDTGLFGYWNATTQLALQNATTKSRPSLQTFPILPILPPDLPSRRVHPGRAGRMEPDGLRILQGLHSGLQSGRGRVCQRPDPTVQSGRARC